MMYTRLAREVGVSKSMVLLGERCAYTVVDPACYPTALRYAVVGGCKEHWVIRVS